MEEDIGGGLTTNMQTITRNNAADRISNHRTQVNTFPGVQSNNTYAGVNDNNDQLISGLLTNTSVVYNENKVIENRSLYDFRPKASSSSLIEQGLEITSPVYSSLVVDITAGFEGAAPDRGAYEYNGEKWIPGIDFTPTLYPWTWPEGGIPPPIENEYSSGFINHHNFEHDDAGLYWDTTGTGIYGSITSNIVHSGDNAYTLVGPNVNWDGVDNKTNQNKAVLLSDTAFEYSPEFTNSNIAITTSFWIKVDQDQDNGAQDRIKLIFKDANQGTIATSQIVVGDPQGENYISANGDWKKITVVFQDVTYMSTYMTHLELWLGNLSGNIYVDDFESIIIDGSELGIPKRTEKVKLVVYPQPINNQEILKISTFATIEEITLFTIHGQLVFNRLGDQKEFPLNNCKPGIYILKIELEGNLYITKKITII